MITTTSDLAAVFGVHTKQWNNLYHDGFLPAGLIPPARGTRARVLGRSEATALVLADSLRKACVSAEFSASFVGGQIARHGAGSVLTAFWRQKQDWLLVAPDTGYSDMFGAGQWGVAADNLEALAHNPRHIIHIDLRPLRQRLEAAADRTSRRAATNDDLSPIEGTPTPAPVLDAMRRVPSPPRTNAHWAGDTPAPRAPAVGK